MTGSERSCTGPRTGDWIVLGPEQDARGGVQRIEARFAGHGYDPHRHDTHSLGHTISGVQSFDYRGARRDSLPSRGVSMRTSARAVETARELLEEEAARRVDSGELERATGTDRIVRLWGARIHVDHVPDDQARVELPPTLSRSLARRHA